MERSAQSSSRSSRLHGRLARRGVYDMGASLGLTGRYLGESTAYQNITSSSAAQFMEDVRLRPGVSPQVRLLSYGSEIVGDLSWGAAQGLRATEVGNVNLRLPRLRSSGGNASVVQSSGALRACLQTHLL
ncbi:MAG: hypothetical protein KF708_19090 [Pirellulales bacterium]|nr:hypothetical protein [Pirellulales bacterium]